MELIEMFTTYGAIGIGIGLIILVARRLIENATDSVWSLMGRYPWRTVATVTIIAEIVLITATYTSISHYFEPGAQPAFLMHVKLAFAGAIFCALLMSGAVIVLLYALIFAIWKVHQDLQDFKKSLNAARKNP